MKAEKNVMTSSAHNSYFFYAIAAVQNERQLCYANAMALWEKAAASALKKEDEFWASIRAQFCLTRSRR